MSSENTSFHDEAPSDREMYKYLETLKKQVHHPKKILKGVVEDDDFDDDDYSQNLKDDDFDPDNDDDFVYRE